jgi:hypothetical protein
VAFAIDGTTQTGENSTGAGTSISFATGLTTTSAPDVIVVQVYLENTTPAVIRTVSSVTVGGISLAKRSGAQDVARFINQEVWWGATATNLTSAAVTVNYSGAADCAAAIAFCVSGANTSTPWDANASLPKVVNNGVNGIPTVAGVSTSNANDMLLGFCSIEPAIAAETAGASYTLIKSFQDVNGDVLACEEQVVATTQSSVSVAFGTTTGSVGAAWMVIVDAIVAAGGAAVVEGPPQFKGRSFPPQWNINRALLLNTRAGPEFSIAPETNTHFIPRAFPRQWNLNRSLYDRRPGPEASSAPETNPQWRGRTWLPQWNVNDSPNLLWNSAEDVPAVVAVDTPPSFVPRSWAANWAPNSSLWRAANDFSPGGLSPPHWRGQTWPPQWNINKSPNLLFNLAEDIPAGLSPPHWQGKPWAAQWNPVRWTLQNPALDVPAVIAFGTPASFTPRSFSAQWNVNLSLKQNTAQDFSASAVETNPQWQGRPWPFQWSLQAALRQNPATDVPPVAVIDTPSSFVPLQWQSQWDVDVSLVRGTAMDPPSAAVDTPAYFIPRTFPGQWNLNLSLRQNTAQDFSSSAVETNPQWQGRPWASQWSLLRSLRQNSATDVPVVVIPDAPPPFVPRNWPPQWRVSLSLRQNTAQDFSSSAVETNPQWQGRPWAAQWSLLRSLWQNSATDAPIVTFGSILNLDRLLALDHVRARSLANNIRLRSLANDHVRVRVLAPLS